MVRDLDAFGQWKKMVYPLALQLADQRPGVYRNGDGKPLVWGADSKAESWIKRYGWPSERDKGLYGEVLLWRRLDGAKNMRCGWVVAYCGPLGSLVWGDCLNVLGGG